MKNKSLPIVILIVVAAIAVLVLFRILTGVEEEKRETIASVTVQKDGQTLIVSRDGSVRLETSEEVFETFWSQEKTDAFFAYFGANYLGDEQALITGGENYISINVNGSTQTYVLDDDELVDAAEEEVSVGDGGGGGGGGNGNSTPTPGSGGTPTPTGTSGGGSGGPSECLFWRLSYCVRLRTPSPTPVSTQVEVEIRDPNCGDNTQTGRTVIGNDLCLTTPTPIP